ncbi:hypothetical protein NHQ30_011245 [Ciborinia camelliae]|nr:hypothetical protein NHQ30_011245 [Ciborinia camelliae]
MLAISHRDFRIQDDALEDILRIMKDACEVIDQSLHKGQGVLVHCVMRERTLDRDQALAFVRPKRSRVQPNMGFWEQLGIWHECHHDVFEFVEGEKLEKNAYREWKIKAGVEMSNRVFTVNDVDVQPSGKT